MNRLEFTWSEYLCLIEKLAKKVKENFIPNQIVGIATGGLIPAMVLSKIFKAPLAILAAESYCVGKDGFKDQKTEVVFSRDLTKTNPGFGNQILIVDDLTDSGETMEKSIEWIKKNYGDSAEQMKTAVIWHKDKSIFQPDFIAEILKPDSAGNYVWIIQPIEKYERGGAI